MTNDAEHMCACCGRPAKRFRPLVMTDKGWICASDDFCLMGTSAEHRRVGRA